MCPAKKFALILPDGKTEMSGICGIIALSGAKPDPEQLSLLTGTLERRGPDGTHSIFDGPVAFGHTLLATTPEALVETMPLTDAGTGCFITADVRLDNRDALFQALGLAGLSRVIGDGELILKAYLHWGDDCVDHLLGDFAFAIWDPRGNRLFCGRDHFGMRQLTYHHAEGQFFAFATEPGALVALDDVPGRVNDVRIADFLEGLESVDMTATFFEGIFRLPAAHVMVLGAQGLQIRRYWTLQAVPELKLNSDVEYEAAFLKVFTEAVRCRLRSNKPVGSMLSGGMDSGSVVAIASELLAKAGKGPLKTFSAVGPDAETCMETRGVRAALKMHDVDACLVQYDELDDYSPDLIALARQMDDPFDGHMTLPRAVYLCAHRSGANVVLDGALGDIVFFPGSQLTRLVQKGKWVQAWRNARDDARYWGVGPSKWNALTRAAWHAFAPRALRKCKSRMSEKSVSDDSILSVDFARKIDIEARWKAEKAQNRVSHPCYGAERAMLISRSFVTAGRERYDRVASALAIEPRDPFADLRVVNFCLSLPGSQITADGWPKLLLRRAMAGRLSDSTRWQMGKTSLGLKFTTSMLTQWPNLQKEFESGLEGMRDCIKPGVRLYGKLPEKGVDTFNISDLSENGRQVLFLQVWKKKWRWIRNDT